MFPAGAQQAPPGQCGVILGRCGVMLQPLAFGVIPGRCGVMPQPLTIVSGAGIGAAGGVTRNRVKRFCFGEVISGPTISLPQSSATAALGAGDSGRAVARAISLLDTSPIAASLFMPLSRADAATCLVISGAAADAVRISLSCGTMGDSPS